ALLRRGAPAPAEPEPRPAAVSGDLLPRRSRGVDPPPPRGARAALRDLRAGRLLWGRDVLSRGRGRAPAAALSGRDHAAALRRRDRAGGRQPARAAAIVATSRARAGRQEHPPRQPDDGPRRDPDGGDRHAVVGPAGPAGGVPVAAAAG